MLESLNAFLSQPRSQRWLAIAVGVVFVTGIASIGQVNSRGDTDVAAVSEDDATDGTLGGPVAGGASTSSTVAGSGGEGGAAGEGGTGGRTGTGGAGAPAPGGAGGAGGGSGGGDVVVPDWGLRTQGITETEVKMGISYNTSGCGDAGILEAMLGSGVTGDMGKAIDAFTRHVNENGGIAGRTLVMVTADDGGGGCPEKALAAARELVDDEKVFAVIPGLHDVSDYVASRRIPTFIGRDDPESLQRIGANGIGLTQEIEGNLTAWAAFGRHYLETSRHKPCLIHPESGVSGDWALYEKILLRKMEDQGLRFVDIVVYKEDVSTAQQQASAAAARMKAKGCDQVWFMAGNPIAVIFFSQAATQAQWFPTWTFTSYMVLSDDDLIARLMDQRQWENAVGLSTRVPPGEHPKEGNCKRIYERYYPGDGQSESAYTKIACALILTTAETMKRGAALTGGRLDANTLLAGADAVTNDFYYDSHVPLDWRFPAPPGPYKTKGWSHYTVVDWNADDQRYDFPEYPIYWEVMGAGKSGGVDLRPLFGNA